MFEKNVLKPAKANEARCIGDKYCATQISVLNSCIFVTHLEFLAHTDSQALN